MHGVGNQIVHGAAPAETDLELRRVDVHIHFFRRNIEEDDGARVPAMHEQRAEARDHGMREEFVPHVAAVHIRIDLAGVRVRTAGLEQPAAHGARGPGSGKVPESFRTLPAENLAHPFPVVLYGGKFQQGPKNWE